MFLGELAHRIEAERPVEPDRMALDEALDVLAADQRQKFTEFLAVELEQHVVVLDLLAAILSYIVGGVGIGAAQPVRERAVDAAVLVLVGDGEREDLRSPNSANLFTAWFRGLSTPSDTAAANLELF